MKPISINLTLFIASFTIFFVSCEKSYLDTKPSTNIVQPTTLQDFQDLLENQNTMATATGGLQQLASDEYYYLSDAGWQAAKTATERNSYIWAQDVYGGEVNIGDWNGPYTAIFYANNVLEGIAALKTGIGSSNYNFIKGWAYFVRAYEYFDLVRNFSVTYDSATASTDLGLPLKLKPGIDNIEQRASLKATYDQIFSDLNQACSLLSSQYPVGHQNHPSKMAAYGFYARVYLSMRNYAKAGLYADSCLSIYNSLINYNTLSTTATFPFTNTGNIESIYASSQIIAYPATQSNNKRHTISIDSTLIKLYDPNDLRLKIFYKTPFPNDYVINGGYYGASLYPYSGLAVDEIYLIRAEASARAGNSAAAMNDLNTLLIKRYKTGTFVPLSASSAQDALSKVLLERRKELVWRGLRWSDLKRLNKEGLNIILTRFINGQTYTLSPNDKRYVFNIPSDEISLSAIQQNPR